MTDAQGAERTAAQLERDLADLAYGASHDLAAPLWHVRGFLDLLFGHLVEDLGVELDQQSEMYRGFVLGALDRMQLMVDGLSEYARITKVPNPFDEVDLSQSAHRALAEHAALVDESGATVDVGELPILRGDRNQLARMMWHLVDNALKYRSTARPLRVSIAAVVLGDVCELDVRDNGEGIDAGMIDRVVGIFNRNHSDETPGAGMGLAICRRIAERHLGELRVQSELGVGTTVSVSLPQSSAAR